MQSTTTRTGSGFQKIEDRIEVDGVRRVAIVSSHPIQYNAPLFRFLASDKRLKLKVFYTWSQSEAGLKYDPEFNLNIDWDIPLLEGYESEFVSNKARRPGSHHFWGIVNPELPQKVLSWKPDMVIVYGWSFYSHLMLMRKLKGKTILAFRGDSHLLSARPGIKSWIRSKVLRWVYKSIDFAYYVGSYNRSYFAKAGLTADQLIFVPHGVDNKRFQSHVIEKGDQLRRKLGIGKDEVVFLYAGKFMMLKNLFFLIQCFKKLNTPNARLVLAGSGILEKVLKELAKDDERIKFMDFQNQSAMPALYNMADVFVLPSYSETWGLGINEAMASGNAIICSDKVGCAPDLVMNGGNGFVVGSKDEEGMLKAMKLLATDKTLLEQYKKASLELISDWSLEKAYKKMADHICSIAVGQKTHN